MVRQYFLLIASDDFFFRFNLRSGEPVMDGAIPISEIMHLPFHKSLKRKNIDDGITKDDVVASPSGSLH